MNDDFNQINNNIISFKNKQNKQNKILNCITTNDNNISDTNNQNYNSNYSPDYKKYSELCEKRIKQLCPNQTFPITLDDLSKNNCLSSMEIRYQIKETQMIKMENEIQNLKNKCSNLEEKNKQMIESREKILKTLKEQKNLLIFPPPDRIPCEKLYEGYTKLYEAFNKISNDKEVAVVSLQNEILINDQQRNYIEILKQTLESNLLKNGIKSQIELYNKINKKRNNNENINNLDNMQECYEELFDVVGLNKKIEDLFKQNNLLELENNKLINDLRDLNNRNNLFREQINDSLKSGIQELEQTKFKIKELESQKQELLEENNLLKQYNDKLKLKFESFQQENININTKIKNFQKKNKDEINEYINKFSSIHEEYQILKNNYEKLQNENELVLSQNQELQEQINILKQENESLINEINNIKDDYNYNYNYNNSKNNNFQSFTNNNDIDSNNRNSLNSMSIKCNASNLTGQRYIDNNINNELNTNSNYNKSNINQNTNNFNLSNNNYNINNNQILNNEIYDLKNYIYNCLANCNEFIKFCFSKYKENELIEEELKENEIWNNFINSITSISQLFQDCYNFLNNIYENQNINNNNIKKIDNKFNSKFNSTKAKSFDDSPPVNLSLSNTENDSFNNTKSNTDKNKEETNNNQNQELLIELEKYKEDNKLIYKNYKKLENENIELFFVNKENKFYYKLISRILQYHINSIEVKTIINKLVILNGKAISLDMEKNKIKIRIDDISGSMSSSGFNNLGSRFNYDNELYNSEELDKLKKMFSSMEKELNDKYIILKNLDKELKTYETRE